MMYCVLLYSLVMSLCVSLLALWGDVVWVVRVFVLCV